MAVPLGVLGRVSRTKLSSTVISRCSRAPARSMPCAYFCAGVMPNSEWGLPS